MRHTLQQARVALRNSRSRREQIAPAVQATAMAAHARSVDQTRLNASVPLVPPKPNELEMATSSFASRAACARLVQIDRRLQHLVAQRQDAEDRLDTAGRTQQMAGGRLRRTHLQLPR